MSDELVSLREFARRDGCDEARVRRGVQRGELPTRSDRLLPASLAGTEWRAGNRLLGVERAPLPKARIAATHKGELPNLAEAQRRHEIALAGLKRQELAIRSKQWISQDELTGAWDAIRHRVRNRLLEVPAAAAACVAVCTRVGEVQAVLRDVVYGALLELSSWELVDTSVTPPVADPRLSSNASALEAETAKVMAQGSLRALEVEIVAGRMISIDDADDSLGRVLEVVRQRMLHIEGALPPRLIGHSVKQIEAVLQRAVLEAVAELEAPQPPAPASTATRKRPHAG